MINENSIQKKYHQGELFLDFKCEKLITGLRETLLVHESFLTETGEKFVILVRGRAETCNQMRKINQMTKNYHGQ